MKIIILGIGNPILGDDGIGVYIARELKKQKIKHVKIDEAQTGGMNLLDLIRGYDKAILIDAIHEKEIKPGTIKRFNIKDVQTMHANNPHDLSFPEALDLAKKLGDQRIPNEIIIIGINLQHIPREFSESLSPEIKQVIPKVIKMVHEELTKLR